MQSSIVRVLALLLACAAINAARADEVYVPESLEPWRDWVLERHPEQPCLSLPDDANVRRCAWIATLEIDAADTGARFAMTVELFAPADVRLPGGADAWPVDVVVAQEGGAGRAAAVTRADGHPRLRLPAGRQTVTGRIEWSRMPESLPVPAEHGVLRLAMAGEPVPQPQREGDRVWLARAAPVGTETAHHALEARVYRHLRDGVPLMLTTTLDLAVSGAPRVETLGRALPEGFELTALDSPLPARLEADGSLRVQVEPGDWRIHVTGRALDMPQSLRTTAVTANWPAQEIWGFEADRGLRVVNVEGPSPIDLSQTAAPFRNIPGFLMTAETELRLAEQFRGDPNPTPDEIHLSRNAWLGFDGEHLVLEDRLDATAARPTRLAASFVPGRIEVDGVPQLVTRIDEAAPGVELPLGRHQILAVSDVDRADLTTVLGWAIDATSVEATLHLPPAWRLLWATGVDHTPTAWLSQWNVWNLFLVLVTVFATARLLGLAAAALAAAALAIVCHEPGSPIYSWIVMLALLAGVRVSRAGVFQRILGTLYVVTLVGTLFATATFAVDGFRKAIYPQLELPAQIVGGQPPTQAYFDLGSASGTAASDMPQMAMEAEPAEAPRAAKERAVPAPAPPTPMYPPGLQVQTGPAVPDWRWHEVPLRWDGPVTAGQPFSLTLAPPLLTRALYVVGPVLLLSLLAAFAIAILPASVALPEAVARFARSAPRAAASLLLLAPLASLLAGLTPGQALAADFPGPELLDQLEQRLTAAPACMPGCANLERVDARADDRTLTLDLVVHADVAVAVPVLRADEAWQPTRLESSGRTVTATRDAEGRLLIAVPAGRQTITVSAPIAHLDRFELNFPMAPGRVTATTTGWTLHGLDQGRLRGATLQFARDVAGAGSQAAGLTGTNPAPYHAVERVLRFDLTWRATTTVRRLAPATGAVPFAVQLLPDESVLTGQVSVVEGRATGVLGPDQASQTFESQFAERPSLTLTAPPLASATERWTLVPSNLWHVESAGIPPLKLESGAAAGPSFQPLPGESLQVTLTRPSPVAGDTITVERVRLVETPGRRSRSSELTLELRASQGGVYPVALPADAVIREVRANGRPEPIPAGGGPLALPVVPGSQTLSVTWESPTPVVFRTRTSQPALAGAARNVSIELALPQDRWPLLVGGPALGPAVTWWSILLLVLLIAVAIARVPGLPLRTRDALLIGLGMSLCNLYGALLAGVWLLVMLARQRLADRLATLGRLPFNALQVLLAAFSVWAVITLAASVPFGLLGAPEMYIDGNGSWAYSLRWFQDQTTGSLPSAWVISLPIWVYRLAMLAWSLWLAFVVVRWVRWAWDSYSTGGAWRRRGDLPTPSAASEAGWRLPEAPQG